MAKMLSLRTKRSRTKSGRDNKLRAIEADTEPRRAVSRDSSSSSSLSLLLLLLLLLLRSSLTAIASWSDDG